MSAIYHPTNKFCAVALSILSEKNYADILVNTKNEIRVQINTKFISPCKSVLDEMETFLNECYDVQAGIEEKDMSPAQQRIKRYEILSIIVRIQFEINNKEYKEQKIIFCWAKK